MLNKSTPTIKTEMIISSQGSPIAELMRKLPPDKYKAAKVEFDDMLTKSICERSSP